MPIPGWERYSPSWFSLADVDSHAALLKYRDIKRAAKAAGNWPPGAAAQKTTAKKPAARAKAARRG